MVARIKALRAGIMLAGGLFVSSGALAVVVGDITLSSALNEPLEAVIELDSLAGVEASEIIVTIGDQAAYDRVDIDRAPFLDDIRFTVEVDNENEGRIILSSTSAVTEPFLNLIVSVSEPGNVTLKEYTLLVELPADSAVTTASEPAPVVAEAAAPATTNNSPDSYTVTTGDTMYEIAANTRPDTGVSVEQMMVAIQRENPDAFIGGNINRLISGRVLRIPAAQDIEVMDRQSALAQISQQSADLAGQPLATGNNAANGAAADTRDQLRVLTGDAGNGAGGSSDLARTINQLENELMLSEENLDRARIENLELNNRLSSLQEQIDLLENIIAIEDERIAALQAELTQQTSATETALASADNAATALGDINDEPPSGLTGLLRNTVVLLGAGLALVLVVLGFLFYRRRQAQAAAEEGAFNPALSDDADDILDADEEKPGLIAGLLARFRRNKDEDDDDDEYETVTLGAPQPAVSAAPQAVAQPKKNSTDNLLDEMGISEEMLSLDDALDGIDSTHPETAEVFEPVEDEAPAIAAAQAEAAAQTLDSDYALTAAAEAFAAIDQDAAEPETVEFNTPVEAAAPVNVPADAEKDDAADTFEFTLKDLPEVEAAAPVAVEEVEVETFEFKPSAPVAEPPAAKVVAAPEALEVIAFPGTPTAKKEPAPEEDDISLDLGDLSFDDTMVTDDDEPSQYTPRTGNECDTKLDLATAYEAMGDVTEAIEILDEVIADGTPAQVETAQRLKETWQNS